ncbi:hypothetical protein DV736_g1250, partial [Chaetothyriales sp. CBS 134916]
MKLTKGTVPVYTVAGSNVTRDLPDWQANNRKVKKNPEYLNRIELLQDFEFEEASQCIRISEDGNWVMSTGTYKPQIHTHYLPNLALSWARHTDTINKTFLILSSDYSKSVHLQEDRSIELHTPGGRHHHMRIPRYGRDLAYECSSTDLLVPAVGHGQNGTGEVFRINLELGRFMSPFEVDIGSDSVSGLQGGIRSGAVNTASIANGSHGLLAFGTSIGTIEYWDSRSRARVASLGVPSDFDGRPEVTALDFHHSGIKLAVGTSNGLVHMYDLRSPSPALTKDQGYGYPILHLEYLNFSSTTRASNTEAKVLSVDKRILKIWGEQDGAPWTSVEPSVDINSVAWCRDSGMFLTANEGRQQHAFFIPQLGPAPRWCSFLDNTVEEMADDPNDPQAFNTRMGGEVYDNQRFLTMAQLRTLNLDHLVGKTNLVRPYMHGYFVKRQLYEEARLIANPISWEEERAKRIQEKIDKDRESRIRGQKKLTAKVNRKMAERIMEREDKRERRRAQRILAQGGDEKQGGGTAAVAAPTSVEQVSSGAQQENGVLADSRFDRLFQDEDFEIDETSREFRSLNPSTKTEPRSNLDHERGLTAVEEEMVDEVPGSSDDEDSEDGGDALYGGYTKGRRGQADEADKISSADYKRRPDKKKRTQKHKSRDQLQMRVSSSLASTISKGRAEQERSFGARAKDAPLVEGKRDHAGGVVGNKVVTFEPTPAKKKSSLGHANGDDNTVSRKARGDRRSASGNTFRRM